MRNYFLLSTLLLFSFFTSAQQVDMEQLKALKIRSIGPAGMSGRVTSIDVDLSQPSTIFIGTASGGVWKSTSGGVKWDPIFDKEAVLSVGAVAINQKNTSEIWVGTGEGNPRNSHNSGKGIYKSIDGGRTWKLMGLEKTKLIHRILIHKDNPNIVYVAALGSAWGANEDRGVFKTTDGGKTWSKILYINDGVGAADLVIDPTNPNKLIAAMWEYGRKPWTFNSGGKDSGLYRTYDGGENWEKITEKEGLPKGDIGRIGLAIAPSKPSIVYALIEAKENGLYKSTDGGHKWEKVATKNIGNRPFYYADIFVDPQNENRIFNLHSYVSKSEDGGKTFKTILPFHSFSGVHPDHHAFWVHPNDPSYMIEGNDGGLNISRDGGHTWRFVANLPLAQFYHINHDMDVPYNVYGGMQDNGSWIGPSWSWKRGGIHNHDWQELYFGDGFDVVPKKGDSRYGYAMSQGGNVGLYNRITGNVRFVKPVHPEGEFLRFNWNAGIAQDPFNDCGVYFGSQYVHKSLDCGETWEIISPDLTTNDTTKQKQGESGGLTIDATQAENFTTILSIEPSTVDKNVIWVSTDDGNLQLTKDGGKNWTNLASRLIGCPAGSWIPQVVASTTDAGSALVVVNDYRRNNWKPYAYKTANYGQTWTRLVDEKKVDGFVWSIVQDPVESNLIFVGTDHGLYFTIDGGTNWTKWTNDFPSVSTSDLKIHPREHDLIIGTFGRAAYVLDDIRPLREMAKTKGKVLNEPFKVFDMQDAYQAIYRSVNGMRFVADANFIGQNKRTGAMINIWVKKEEKKTENNIDNAKGKKKKSKGKSIEENKDKAKEKKKKPEKVKIQVFDMEGDTIRTFSSEIKPGMNRVYWHLNRTGVRYPSYRNSKPEDNEPGGPWVLPGKYKLVVHYGELKDSTEVMVHRDPRDEINLSALKEQDQAYEDYTALVKIATEGFNRLKEAKKIIPLVDAQLVNVVDSTKQDIAKQGKAMKDSIELLMKTYMRPQGAKGIDSFSPSLNRYIWRASSYISDADGMPAQNAIYAIDKAKKEINEVINKINHFIDHDWATYRKNVEAIEYSLFKDFKPIKME